MRIKTDRRTALEKSVDRYLDRLLVASGEKNPVRRRVFEKDVNYALQLMEAFPQRYAEATAYDIYAVDADFTKAVAKVDEAARTLERFGLHVSLPVVIEDPDLIKVECAMALVDTLRTLDAMAEDAAELFVSEAVDELLHKRVFDDIQHSQISELIHRYVHEKISEEELDKIAMEKDYLQVYLKGL